MSSLLDSRSRARRWLAVLSLAHACAAPEDGASEQGTSRSVPRARLAAPPCVTESELGEAEFYAWDESTPLDLPNGSLVRCQELTRGAQDSHRKFRVLYKTSTLVTEGGATRELPVVASGQLYVPLDVGDAYDEARDQPLLVNTHGAIGVIPECAPSRRRSLDSPAAMRDLGAVLPDAVIAVPDYLGLGVDHGYRVPDSRRKTPFGAYAFDRVTHPFLSIESEGRSIIDLVRASEQLDAARTSDASKWLVVGVSQGGHAALATAEVYSRGYGPSPRLMGAIAGAPASELQNDAWWPSEAEGALHAMLTAGATLENRDLRASITLNEFAITAFAGTTNKSCFDTPAQLFEWALAYRSSLLPSVFAPGRSPFRGNDPALLAVFEENSPGRQRLTVPVFIGTLRGDPLIREERVRAMVARSRVLNDDKVQFCYYQNVVDGPSNLARAENHDAYRRMFPQRDGQGRWRDAPGFVECSGPAGATQVLSPLAWAKLAVEEKL